MHHISINVRSTKDIYHIKIKICFKSFKLQRLFILKLNRTIPMLPKNNSVQPKSFIAVIRSNRRESLLTSVAIWIFQWNQLHRLGHSHEWAIIIDIWLYVLSSPSFIYDFWPILLLQFRSQSSHMSKKRHCLPFSFTFYAFLLQTRKKTDKYERYLLLTHTMSNQFLTLFCWAHPFCCPLIFLVQFIFIRISFFTKGTSSITVIISQNVLVVLFHSKCSIQMIPLI